MAESKHVLKMRFAIT